MLAVIVNRVLEGMDEWKWDCRRLMLLDVSMCLVVLFSDFGINTNPKILCPEDLFQADHELNTCKRPFSSLFRQEGEEPLLRFKHQKEESTTVRNRLHNAGLYKKTSWNEAICQENMFLGWAVRRVQIFSGRLRTALS
ncbi:HTH_Tnp_Tc3_2 domain-containing protein [Trichonephila clavipes]|nr:HTH_Tnp_Tc3_2 domain-containing protein [Trichonephila clavipes]